MVDSEIIKEGITKADEDFEFARVNLEEDKPFLRSNMFPFSASCLEIP